MPATKKVSQPKGEEDGPAETVKIGGLRSAAKRGRSNKVDTKSEISAEPKVDTFNTLTDKIARKLLKDLSLELSKEKKDSVASFLNDPLLQVQDNSIHMTVGSRLISESIRELSPRIKKYFESTGYLLNELKCTVNATEIEEYKVFTPEQKFAQMAKEFPVLKDFASRFNLDING